MTWASTCPRPFMAAFHPVSDQPLHAPGPLWQPFIPSPTSLYMPQALYGSLSSRLRPASTCPRPFMAAFHPVSDQPLHAPGPLWQPFIPSPTSLYMPQALYGSLSSRLRPASTCPRPFMAAFHPVSDQPLHAPGPLWQPFIPSPTSLYMPQALYGSLSSRLRPASTCPRPFMAAFHPVSDQPLHAPGPLWQPFIPSPTSLYMPQALYGSLSSRLRPASTCPRPFMAAFHPVSDQPLHAPGPLWQPFIPSPTSLYMPQALYGSLSSRLRPASTCPRPFMAAFHPVYDQPLHAPGPLWQPFIPSTTSLYMPQALYGSLSSRLRPASTCPRPFMAAFHPVSDQPLHAPGPLWQPFIPSPTTLQS